MKSLTPPPRTRAIVDPLEAELREMAIAAERGFPNFPPPPPPLDAKSAALARAQIGPLAKRVELDAIQILARVLLWIVFAALMLGAWAFWRSLWS